MVLSASNDPALLAAWAQRLSASVSISAQSEGYSLYLPLYSETQASSFELLSWKKGARMYTCMPTGYWAPRALKSSMLERVTIGNLVKKLGSTASACLTKLTWSWLKMFE